MPIIELSDVSKVYQQGPVTVKALDHFSLSVERGELLALSGPSGSGKTTCLNLIGALDLPSSGEITVDGQRLSGLNPAATARLRRDRIGFVFQAYNLIPVLTAYENTEFILALQDMPEAERRGRVMAMLKEVGLEILDAQGLARCIKHLFRVVPVDGPTACLGGGG